MSKPKYVMNSKKGDYRILPYQPGLDENTDYIHISNEDAEAVMSGKKTGSQVIKEIFLRSRMAEVDSLAVAQPQESDKPDKPADLPSADTEPALDFSTMTRIGLHTLRVSDLRTFAKERFDLVFPPATNKEAMIAQLSEKMQESK